MSSGPLSTGLAVLLAGVLSATTLGVLALARRHLPHDHPSGRSLHGRPVVRVGGLAIWAGFLPAALASDVPGTGGSIWLGAWLAITVVSVADDWRAVRPAVRLVVHLLAALAVVAAMLRHDAAAGLSPTHLLAMALMVPCLVWSANLFNFMDGSDGLAATMAVLGFGAYGTAALRADAPAIAYLALAAATLPFLAVNVPPARAFMGDGGAVPLGFLAALFGIAGVRADIWPQWFPLLVFLPFVADATVTVARRLARGEHVFEPHKTHYYQRLHRMGAGHAGTLLFYGVLIAGTCASALFTLASDAAAGWWMLGAWSAAIGALFAGIDYHWRKEESP